MKLVSKNPDANEPSFQIENYSEAEKQFFLGLGFTEKISNVPIAFRGKNGDVGGDTLNFMGSGIFGLFSSEEFETITHAIFEFTKLKHLQLHYPDEF